MGRNASGRCQQSLIPPAVRRMTRPIYPGRCAVMEAAGSTNGKGAVALSCRRVSVGGCRLAGPALRVILTLLVSASVPGFAGCATVGALGGSHRGDRAAADESDIDPVRAHKRLAQIEPAVSKPISAEPVKELSERATRQIAKSEKLAGEQRYTEAAIELERALRYDPEHPRIHRSLAMLHWSAGNLERARTHVTKSLERFAHLGHRPCRERPTVEDVHPWLQLK